MYKPWMITRIVYLFLLSFLSVPACVITDNKPAASGSVKEIACFFNKQESIDAGSFIDSIRYVKLETDSNCLIGQVKKIVYSHQLYYILNGHSDRICIFDRDGKFLSRLYNQGEGPDAYTLINDFTVNPSDSAVTILDSSQKKLLTYNSDWKLVNKIELPSFIRLLQAVSPEEYITYNEEVGIARLSLSGQKEPLIPFSGFIPGLPMNDMGYLYRIGDTVAIFSVADNTVYHLKEGIAAPVYRLVYDRPTPADVYRKKRSGFDVCVVMHKETGRWIFQALTSIKDHKIYYLLYDKENDRLINIKEFNNLTDQLFPPAAPAQADDRLIYAQYLPASELKKQLADHPDNRLSVSLKEIIRLSTDDDNPVLQLVYLKK